MKTEDSTTEGYIIGGFSYTVEEEQKAAEIRALQDDHPYKESRKKCFEIEINKAFPEETGVPYGLNLSTVNISSQEIAAGADYVLTHPRESRRSIRNLL